MSDTEVIQIRARLFVRSDGSVRAIRDRSGVSGYRPTPDDSVRNGEQAIAVDLKLPKSFFEDRLKINLEVPESKKQSESMTLKYDDKSGGWS